MSCWNGCDLSALEDLDEQVRAREIRQALGILLEEDEEPLNMGEKTRLAQELEFEILGLGPLEPFCPTPPSRISWSTATIRSTSKGGAAGSDRCQVPG